MSFCCCTIPNQLASKNIVHDQISISKRYMFIEKCIKLDCRRRKKYAKLKVLFPLLKILSTNSVYSKKRLEGKGRRRIA